MDGLVQAAQPLFATAFGARGVEVSWLEYVAFVLALAMVRLNIRVDARDWPRAITSSLLCRALFWNSRLYGKASLQIFFAVVAGWGWWKWLRGTCTDGAALRVRWPGARGRWALVVVFALAWPATGAFQRRYTDTDVPWWDAFLGAAIVIGHWLLSRKHVENWIVWLVVNVASVQLFADKGLWLTGLLYAVFVTFSAQGLVARRRIAQEQAA